jgi:outer membrane protein OmpA-like peptidoglycan-associated protein
VYLLEPAVTLGAVTVGADGSFRAVLPVPITVRPGDRVVQINGLTTGQQVRSVSLPARVPAAGGSSGAVAGKVTRVKTTVYFASGSPELTASAKRALARLATRVPAGAKDVTVQCIGFVQPTRNTSNDKQLSTDRAVNSCEQVKANGVKGPQVISGQGRAKQTNATARRVEVTIAYRR